MASTSSRLVFASSAAALLLMLLVVMDRPAGTEAGHKHGAHGTACIVKGSYCSCHYCKCEKGWVPMLVAAVHPPLLALAVVAGAVGALYDAGGAVGAVLVPVAVEPGLGS